MTLGKIRAAINRQISHEDLDLWFGLSYASFAVLPRVLMKEMPERWQAEMARLLFEFDDAFTASDGLPFDGWTVRATERGKIVRMPSWLKNYRHPESSAIRALKSARYWKVQDYLKKRKERNALEVRT
jgi:hypothetical protein